MCGIILSLSLNHSENPFLADLKVQVARRGPDSQNQFQVSVGEGYRLQVFGYVLHLRGLNPTSQPIVSGLGNVLNFNGELFGGDIQVDEGENDGFNLSLVLDRCTTQAEVVEVMDRKVKGPYSFIYYQKVSHSLYFGRDRLGRRSLLKLNYKGSLILSSLSPFDGCTEYPELVVEEVEPDYLFKVDLNRPSEIIRLTRDTFHHNLPQYLCLNRQLETGLEGGGEVVDMFFQLMDQSVRVRVQAIPKLVKVETSPKVAILFSGGIDCTLLAYLTHLNLPSHIEVDLLNVAFENPRVLKHNQGQEDKYDVPDRRTGLSSLTELRSLCPGRIFNFVEIDVAYSEVVQYKGRVIHLMYPNFTVMDQSIALAFWFASRGVGTLDARPYTTPCKVLLSGLGADEQLGGYSRHRTAYQRGGVPQLLDELQLDLTRLPQRNLGRDDRITADHARELRYPFLDVQVIQYLSQLPLPYKMDLSLNPGLGDKLLLRQLMGKLGFSKVAGEKKRAIQFGTRSAKMELDSTKVQGHHTLAP